MKSETSFHRIKEVVLDKIVVYFLSRSSTRFNLRNKLCIARKINQGHCQCQFSPSVVRKLSHCNVCKEKIRSCKNTTRFGRCDARVR